MVNMYSMGMMGGGMYGMGGMNYGSGGNVHQQLKARYGVGYEDFGTRPYAQPYPTAVIPRTPETPLQKSWFGRLIRKLYS